MFKQLKNSAKAFLDAAKRQRLIYGLVAFFIAALITQSLIMAGNVNLTIVMALAIFCSASFFYFNPVAAIKIEVENPGETELKEIYLPEFLKEITQYIQYLFWLICAIFGLFIGIINCLTAVNLADLDKNKAILKSFTQTCIPIILFVAIALLIDIIPNNLFYNSKANFKNCKMQQAGAASSEQQAASRSSKQEQRAASRSRSSKKQ